MMDIFQRRPFWLVTSVALALPLFAGLLLARIGPEAPLVLIALAAGTAIAIVLVHQPFLTLCIALVARMLPDQFRFEPVYSVAGYALVVLALAAWGLEVATRRRRMVVDEVTVLFAIYIAWSTVTLLWAADPMKGTRWLGTYVIGWALMFLAINQVRSLRDIDGIMRVLEFLGWLNILMGLWVIATKGIDFGHRLKVFNANENQYGIFLLLFLPGAIWPVLRAEESRRRTRMLLSIAYIACTLMLIALSGSRGSAISLVLLLLAFWFWQPTRPWARVGAGIVLVILAVAPVMFEVILRRFETHEVEAFGGREILWQASTTLINDFAWTGVGAGNGPQALHKYIASLTSYYNYRSDLPGHNPFLEVGIQSGYLGMLLYCAAIFAASIRFARARTRPLLRDGPMRGYFPLVLAAAIGYAISWVKSGGMENDPSLFLLLALLLIPSAMEEASAPDRTTRRRSAMAAASRDTRRAAPASTQ